MAIVIRRKIEPQVTRRTEIIDDLAAFDCSAGSPFCNDDEMMAFFTAWAQADRPRNVWIGYVMEGRTRKIGILPGHPPSIP